MAKSDPKRRARKVRREPLIHSHLERVSRNLIEEHPDIVRGYIGRNAGIYALYKKGKLYYVGLAKGLTSRVRAHKRDRHGMSWDRFSIYLTIKDQHIKEIESLLLQIARPDGNKVGGKPAGSKDMSRVIAAAIRQKNRSAIDALFGKKRKEGKSNKRVTVESALLLRFLPLGARLRALYNGKTIHARARKDGRVGYKGKIYPSVTAAAKVAAKRPMNGWWFWRVERGKGNWVRLNKVRKAGTPVFPR